MVDWTCTPKKAELATAGVREQIVQNEPNSWRGRVGRGLGDVGRGANVRNEPNLPPAALGPAGLIVRNEPNLRESSAGRGGPIVPNKPNSWEPAGPGVGCTNKANSPRTDQDGWWPAGPDVLPPLGTIVQNKPNYPQAI